MLKMQTNIHHVLLTGATGVLGKRILLEILQHGQIKVTCVIRSNKNKSYSDRAHNLVEELKINNNLMNLDERLFFVEGDVTREKWGISPKDQSVFALVDSLIHSAADVSLDLSETEAEKNIINSCREMLEIQGLILQSGKVCKIDYVSTVGVLGSSQFPLREEICLETRKFHNNYEAYKAKAEALVSEVKTHHPERKITIHRPSMIVGDSITGTVSSFQIFYFILSLFIKIDKKRVFFLPPVLDYKIDTIPVDFVARAIFLSALNDYPFFVLNHCSGPEYSCSVGSIIKLARESGYPIRKNFFVSAFVIKLVLFGLGLIFFNSKKIKKIIKLYEALLVYGGASPRFLNNKTLDFYKEAGLSLPIPQDYLGNVIRYFVEKRRKL